jgi:23S rRNA pseudouridine1911/1915/1917 synthase
MRGKTVTAPAQHRFVIDDTLSGTRLDKALAALLPALSRSRLQALIQAGHVHLDGAKPVIDVSHRVRAGDVVTLAIPEPESATPEGQEIPLDVVYEDEHLIVINKPAGLVVHPAPGNPDRTLVNALIAHCGESLSGIGGVKRPGIVHRLDKDTSGLMVVAKTDEAHAGLAEAFAARRIERAYEAVVWGAPTPPAGRIEGAIGRDARNRKKMAVVTRGGKSAVTNYRTLERFGDIAALVECRLETGRTHQIRVHMTQMGHPLVGDPLYGRSRRRRISGLPAPVAAALTGFPRQALHARLIGFDHPVTGRHLKFESECPSDIQDLKRVLHRGLSKN